MKNNRKLTTLLIVLLPLMSFAQDAFRYQAVARDSSGATITNQLIGVQISIILDDESNPAIYEEIHQPESNNYGVINLSIGDGIPMTGDFSTINWGQKAFIKVEMDLAGGTNYTVSSVAEILSVPRALYAENAGNVNSSKFGIYVTDFGAIGDGSADDTDAFEAAIDSAFITGATLYIPRGVYKITRTLEVKAGVVIQGESAGSEPLQTPHNGSLIWYEGNGFAFKITGHNANVRDLIIRDKSSNQATGGLQLLADGYALETVQLSNLLISGFTNGAGIQLEAKNSGGIAYITMYGLRIRHAKVGIHIKEDASSYVNSNAFYHCQISGGGFDYGLLIDGGNNNVFHGLIIEPPSTNEGHLVVNEGEIIGNEIRIEGNSQGATKPLIYFETGTKDSKLTGTYAGGLTLDKGNNYIGLRSGKAIQYRNSNVNKFKNATFFTPNGTTIQDWDITGTGVYFQVLSPELTENHNVLKITIPAGTIMRIEPSALARPQVKDLPMYDQVNFGFHAKVSQNNIAYTATNAPQGWAASTAHSGSGEWEFVGMNAVVNRSTAAIFRFEVNNTTGGTITVYLSTPTLTFGNQLPTLDESPLFASGGTLTGQLTHAMATVTTPGNGFLTLPLNANYFEITNTQTIFRINHLTADRVPKGTVITLLFNQSGTNVSNSGYLLLKGGFTSVTNSSLTLISNGNGTWREVNRNN
ncbi:MAG: glycosyl hydrolase family 28-related protein [Saprospiraceae bacterium]